MNVLFNKSKNIKVPTTYINAIIDHRSAKF